MTSTKQLEANRRNALASTGPRTPEGKAAVRFNALKLGLDAMSLIISGEDPQAFQELADQLNAACNPEGPREQLLVDRMAAHSWRLARILKAEPLVWEKTFVPLRNAGAPDETKTGDALHDNQHSFHRIQRLIAGIERSYNQAASALDRLQSARQREAPGEEFVSSNPATPTNQTEIPTNGFVPSNPASEAGKEIPTPEPAVPEPSAHHEVVFSKSTTTTNQASNPENGFVPSNPASEASQEIPNPQSPPPTSPFSSRYHKEVPKLPEVSEHHPCGSSN